MKKYHSDRIQEEPLVMNNKRSSSNKKLRKVSEEGKPKVQTKKRISLPASKLQKNNSIGKVKLSIKNDKISPEMRKPLNHSSFSPKRKTSPFEFSINLRYELSHLERSLEEFYTKNSKMLSKRETAFIDYFKNLNNHLITIGNRFPKWNKLLKVFVQLIGSPLESIFLQFQKIIQSHDDNEKEKNSLQKKLDLSNSRMKEMKVKSKTSHQYSELQEVLIQNIQLKNSLNRAKLQLKENNSKENMLTKLVYEIRMAGVDVDSIYENRIKADLPPSRTEGCEYEYEGNLHQENRIDTEFTDESISPLLREDQLNHSDKRINQMYNDIDGQPKVYLNINSIKQKDSKIVGFHEEFMSKIDEFSQSWRQAALKEKRY